MASLNPHTSLNFQYMGQDHSIALPSSVPFQIIENPGQHRALFTFEKFAERVTAGASHALLASQRMLLVMNDAYRLTPTIPILDWLDRYFNELGLPPLESRADVLVATGTHEVQSENQLRQILGNWYAKFQGRITSHDCRQNKNLREVGIDTFGKTVSVNKALYDYSSVVVIGSVEPHYFAGLTGGRKSIIPGLADFASVERNHNLANQLTATPLALKGNPVAEHLDEMLGLCKTDHVVSIQAVLDQQDRLVDCTVGDIRTSFHDAVRTAREIYECVIDQPVDLMIAHIREPLNRNLYQAQKGLENTQMGVKDHGVVVVIAECEEGIGSKHFFELAKEWDSVKNMPRDGVLRFGSHKLSRVISIARRIGVNLLSSLPNETVSQVFYRPLRSVSVLELLIREMERSRDSLRIAYVPNAGHTVVRVRS